MMNAKQDPKTAGEAQELQLLRLMNELVSVMEREIVVVEERLNEQLPELVSRKQRLFVDYQAEFKAATQQKEWLAALPMAQKKLLQQAGVTLRDVAERNARVLKSAAMATQRLLQGIMSSVRDEKCGRNGYETMVQPQNATMESVIFKTTA